jgi:hypothetical protein
MTPTALVATLLAFQEGDMQHVNGAAGVVPVCLLKALTPERVAYMEYRYPGRKIGEAMMKGQEI